jgi:hypothetical protein
MRTPWIYVKQRETQIENFTSAAFMVLPNIYPVSRQMLIFGYLSQVETTTTDVFTTSTVTTAVTQVSRSLS